MKTYLKKKMHQILMRTLCKVSCVELQLQLLLERFYFTSFKRMYYTWYDYSKIYLASHDSLLRL